MTKTIQDMGLESIFHDGTAASAYHLSESLDWSSLSTQMKNRVILVPTHTQTLPNLELHEEKKIDVSHTDI